MRYAWGLLALPLLLTALPTTASAETLTGRVLSVQDGSHMTMQIGNRTERVALIGVSAPAPWSSDCGKKSLAFTQALVLGKTIRLETDRQQRDAQGNLLAYAYLGPRALVNQDVILRGYATADVNSVNSAHNGDLLAAQQIAKGKGLCVWRTTGQSRTWQPNHWPPRTYQSGGHWDHGNPPKWHPNGKGDDKNPPDKDKDHDKAHGHD